MANGPFSIDVDRRRSSGVEPGKHEMNKASPESGKRGHASRMWIWGAAVSVMLILMTGLLGWTDRGRQIQFFLRGGLVNLGYRMQDHLESYDFEHHDDITPEEVWTEVLKQNVLAAFVRYEFPRMVAASSGGDRRVYRRAA